MEKDNPTEMDSEIDSQYLAPEVSSLYGTALTALFAALITAGAYISIPIGPVPLVLQNFFVLLAGAVLGPRLGLACVGLYLFLGAVGLPVFSGGTGGFARILGPTGGYLMGYLPAVFVIGILSFDRKPVKVVAGMVAGSGILYLCGVSWLKVSTSMTWQAALSAGCYPFLAGDIVKMTAAAAIFLLLPPIYSARGQERRNTAAAAVGETEKD